jgi:hypothetical protein
MRAREGWAWLLNSTQRHYFMGSGRRTLCGKFMLLKIWVQAPTPNGVETSNDCASCRRQHRAIENQKTQVRSDVAVRVLESNRIEQDKKIINLK